MKNANNQLNKLFKKSKIIGHNELFQGFFSPSGLNDNDLVMFKSNRLQLRIALIGFLLLVSSTIILQMHKKIIKNKKHVTYTEKKRRLRAIQAK